MHDHTTIKSRVVEARERFRAKVDGLQRQITHARRYVESPWIQFGAAVTVGYRLGCERHEPPEKIVYRREPRESIAHAIVRTALVTIVTSAIRRALADSGTNATSEPVH